MWGVHVCHLVLFMCWCEHCIKKNTFLNLHPNLTLLYCVNVSSSGSDRRTSRIPKMAPVHLDIPFSNSFTRGGECCALVSYSTRRVCIQFAHILDNQNNLWRRSWFSKFLVPLSFVYLVHIFSLFCLVIKHIISHFRNLSEYVIAIW